MENEMQADTNPKSSKSAGQFLRVYCFEVALAAVKVVLPMNQNQGHETSCLC